MDQTKIVPIDYVYKACPNCGRYRVEEYTNGDEICEKCRWNLTKQRYEVDDENKKKKEYS